MREILYRGKTIQWHGRNGEPDTDMRPPHWVTGSLLKATDRIWEIWGKGFIVVVQPETRGQYTGLTDSKGVKIFEGDIVRRHSIVLGKEVICNFVVVFEDSAWRCKYRDGDRPIFIMTQEYIEMHPIEVIGNRWDNPELLEG